MTSFERIIGVTVKPHLLKELYSAPNISASASAANNQFGLSSISDISRQLSQSGLMSSPLMSIPITAECNNRCRRSVRCRAFLVDYSRHTCYSVESPGSISTATGLSSSSLASQSGLLRSPAPIQLEPTQERTSYFEKVCLNLPAIECDRAWVYERVMAYHLHGYDDKLIEEVQSRIKCQELCLNEQEFRCRSAEYDYLTMQCRLSMLDRHSKPNAFRPTTSNVDYFENQCVSIGSQCDAFERFEDMDLGRAEIMRPANTSDQCQQICTQTIKAFICRSFTWNPQTSRCYLNSVNTNMLGGLDKLIKAPGLTYYQRNDCVDLKLECDTSAMTLNLRTNEPFRGRMYVRDEPNQCESAGRSSSSSPGSLVSSLSIPFQGQARCATRELPSRYSSVVVVQQHPLIQRKSDRYIKLVCDFQTANKTITSTYNVVANPWTSTALINSTSFAPKIKLRITDKFGTDITGAKLGDELYLRIEAESDSVYDMVARSVLAKSGGTEESIVLIDKDGCPTDFRIFPALRKHNRRTIIGKFDAFKFSSDVVVRFQVDVQFCLNQCPPTSCDQLGNSNSLLMNSHEQQLNQTSQRQQPTTQQPQLDQYSNVGSLLGNLATITTNQPASGALDSSVLETAPSTSSTRAPGQPHRSEPPYYMDRPAQAHSPPANHPLPAYLQQSSSNASLPADPQMFEPRMAPANQIEEELSALPRSGGVGDRKRRRRSAEPIPETPSNVPLQREIIVEPTTTQSSENSSQFKQRMRKSRREGKKGDQPEGEGLTQQRSKRLNEPATNGK